MHIRDHIQAIREGIRKGQYLNEASVSQGIVLRLLAAMGWPAYDTQIVSPEFSLEGRRVDFGLCHPPGKPIAFVEVKQIGQSENAERQLFEYAFHVGIPIAILTDGQQWNFFLPAEQGSYGDRRVYKLDIVERDIEECVNRLTRYLAYSSVCSGSALESARVDYRNISKDRQIAETLPRALSSLIDDEDELLIELVADKVESLCGYKPDPDTVAKFLRTPEQPRKFGNGGEIVRSDRRLKVAEKEVAYRDDEQSKGFGLVVSGARHDARSAREVLVKLIRLLAKKDSTFLERFASLPKHGRTRRYLARNSADLYPGRPDLTQEFSVEVEPGWWLGVNLSRAAIDRIARMATDVAGLRYGSDVILSLGD